jgi:hypothetical protein
MPQVKALKKIYKAEQPVADHLKGGLVYPRNSLFAIDDDKAMASLVEINQCVEAHKAHEKFEVDQDTADRLIADKLVELVPEKASEKASEKA